MIDSNNAREPKPTPTGFTKWLRSGGLIERWAKESLISAPIVAVMVLYIYFRAIVRVDSVFSWFTYLGVTFAGSIVVGLYYAQNSLKKYPDESRLDQNLPEFGNPIDPK